MNIFLVPYTWARHLQIAMFTGGMAMLAWWLLLTFWIFAGPLWPLAWDGAMFLSVLAGATAGASLLAEGNLRRQHILLRLGRAAGAAAISAAIGLAWYWVWHKWTGPILLPEASADDLTDPSFVSLRLRLGAWVMVGFCTAAGPIILRKGAGLLDHIFAGFAAGLAGAATWHVGNFTDLVGWNDLYLSAGAAALVWGAVFGLLAWGIPDELYAGWLRVLTPNRYGYRIPVDALDQSPNERFVGHFPRGLDLWLPVEEGVNELHISIAVDAEQRYRARGLTLQPTRIRRFLERIDIRYDPRRPAPLETRLSSGDRIELGEGEQSSMLEFVMLPREEK